MGQLRDKNIKAAHEVVSIGLEQLHSDALQRLINHIEGGGEVLL